MIQRIRQFERLEDNVQEYASAISLWYGVLAATENPSDLSSDCQDLEVAEVCLGGELRMVNNDICVFLVFHLAVTYPHH